MKFCFYFVKLFVFYLFFIKNQKSLALAKKSVSVSRTFSKFIRPSSPKKVTPRKPETHKSPNLNKNESPSNNHKSNNSIIHDDRKEKKDHIYKKENKDHHNKKELNEANNKNANKEKNDKKAYQESNEKRENKESMEKKGHEETNEKKVNKELIEQKEDNIKKQANIIQTYNPTSTVSTAEHNSSKPNWSSEIISSIGSSIAGNAIGNVISDKLLKSDHQKHEKNQANKNHFGKDHFDTRKYNSNNNKRLYDFIVFSVQNKVSTCMQNKYKNTNCDIGPDKVKWTIHGLWPNSINGTHPSYCSKKENNLEVFSKELKERLEVYWPSLKTYKNQDFWNHEWQKHGTCINFTELINNSETKYSHLDEKIIYFSKSLELLDNFNIMNKILFNSVDDLSKNIKLRTNFANIDIICNYDKKTKRQYVNELRFKLDKNFEFSSNNTSPQDSNCLRSKPIYIYPEKISSDINSSFIKYNIILLLIVFLV